MRRVLMVAYYFPPLTDSGVQRPLKFCKYLPEFGWQPVVLTVQNAPNLQRDPTLLQEVPKNVEVHRAQMLSDTIANAAAFVGGSRLAEGVRWRLRERFSVPDLFALWRRPAVRAALKIFKNSRFDAIYATGYPWTGLLVGRDVARHTRVPWLADFRDPWVGDDTFRVERPLHPQEVELEQSVVRSARTVTCVSENMTDDFRRAFATEPPEKFQTIWNGFDAAEFDALPAPACRSADGLIRVAYTGVFRPQYGPQLLFEAVKRLKEQSPGAISRLRIVSAGFQPGRAADYGIADCVEERGPVSHREALAIMREADALFTPLPAGSFSRFAVPGKLYEYLGSGKPVIAEAPPNSEVARILATVGGAKILSDGVDGLVDTLRHLCAAGTLDVRPLQRDRLAQFERRTQTATLARLLSALSEDDAHRGITRS
jgi:glycosyltransferase involved in cell wall biosynthesis